MVIDVLAGLITTALFLLTPVALYEAGRHVYRAVRSRHRASHRSGVGKHARRRA